MSKKVIFCTPSISGPIQPYIEALAASLPLIEAAGWTHGYAQEVGNPYISAARLSMCRKALDAKADTVVFIDYDLSWAPKDLLTLLETEGDVVAGTYRFKNSAEEVYMGQLRVDENDRPIVRKSDGALDTYLAPAGFLKVTRQALCIFMKAYPELVCGDPLAPSIDLFNHGARNGAWWGEDYAFCDRWAKLGGKIWTPPNMNLHHHSGGRAPTPVYDNELKKWIVQEQYNGNEIFEGNLHNFLLRQAGGSATPKEPEMFTKGPANKRAGTKTGNAPHPSKDDKAFGSKTEYAPFSTTNISTGGIPPKQGGKNMG